MAIMSCLLILQNFKKYKIVQAFSFICMIIQFTYVTFFAGRSVKMETMLIKKFQYYITLISFFSLFIYIFTHWINKLQNLISKFIEAQSVFKHIFDHSEESIIIFTDSKVEYVNDTFL